MQDIEPSGPQPPIRRSPGPAMKWALAASITVVMLLTSFVAGELLFRYRERTRDTVPGTFPTLYYNHARLQHALRRGFDYFGWIRINDAGFRGDPLDPVGRDRRLRLMVVGSSTVFDVAVTSNQRTWPHLLEEELLAAGVNAEVINAGVPGYWLTDNLIRLHTDLRQHQPDVILLYEGHNDVIGTLARLRRVTETRSVERPGEIRTAGPLRRWLELNSMFYGKLAGRLEAISFRSSEPAFLPFRTVLQRSIPHWEANYRAFFALSRAHGIPVIASSLVRMSGLPGDSAVSASWGMAMPFASVLEVQQAYDSLTASMHRAAASEGVPVIDASVFPLTDARWYAKFDPVHFNDDGSARMARHMALALLASNLLQRQQALARRRPRDRRARRAPQKIV